MINIKINLAATVFAVCLGCGIIVLACKMPTEDCKAAFMHLTSSDMFKHAKAISLDYDYNQK